MVEQKTNNLASLDANESTKKQIAWLEQQLIGSIKEHQLLGREITSLEKDIDSFAQEYHDEVGSLVEKLDTLEAQVSGQRPQKDKPANTSQIDCNVPMISNSGAILHNEEKEEALRESELHRYEDEALEGESKRLYRSLAKKIHPDITSKDEPEAERAFAILKEAHKNQDLSTMLLLDRALNNNKASPISTQLEVMQQQFEALQRQNDELRRERHQLMRSDTYTLRIRALNAHVEGKNLLKAIAASIQIQIAEKEKTLQTARYQ